MKKRNENWKIYDFIDVESIMRAKKSFLIFRKHDNRLTNFFQLFDEKKVLLQWFISHFYDFLCSTKMKWGKFVWLLRSYWMEIGCILYLLTLLGNFLMRNLSMSKIVFFSRLEIHNLTSSTPHADLHTSQKI